MAERPVAHAIGGDSVRPCRTSTAPASRTLLAAEQAEYTQRHPRSRELFEQGSNLFGKVPMTWMNKWSGGFPLYLEHARGNRISDVDGHTYVDFALGDTGAMAGHSPRPTVEAVARRMGDLGGITTMLPTAEAQGWVPS